ncbi:MAG: hypothetical protein F4W95_01440 [Chloroflexi bacterium]|nr:hypothetical protein [Chloroflexota bacterium]MYD47129.1 hypothetical protein [Chloroflexota bacterium]
MVTSIGGMLATIMLLIFFGAWAVSASSDTDVAGVLSGATVGFAGNVSTPYTPTTAGASDNVPRLASAANGSAPADTWWGKALLGACPLH